MLTAGVGASDKEVSLGDSPHQLEREAEGWTKASMWDVCSGRLGRGLSRSRRQLTCPL